MREPVTRVAVSWSSGKDSAWSLHLLRQDPTIEVVALFTTLNEQFDRVAMHAVRRELLEASKPNPSASRSGPFPSPGPAPMNNTKPA